MADLGFLSRLRLLEGLGREDLKEFAQLIRTREFSAGQVIVREGEKGDSLFIIREGEVGVSLAITLPVSGKEREKVLVSLHPGEIFGEMAFILGQEQRSATAQARTEVVLYEVKSSDFEDFVERNPRAGLYIFRNIAKIIADRLRKANQDIAKLTTVLSVVLGQWQGSEL